MNQLESLPLGIEFRELIKLMVDYWPEHERFLIKGILDRSEEQLLDSNVLAQIIGKIAKEDIWEYCQSYRFLCEQLNQEEFYFRRTGGYRFKTTSEVNAYISQKPEFMKKYMQGLLISQLFWNNHIGIFGHLRNRFLPKNLAGYRHLEIGPGHGLLLYLAASDDRCSYSEAWDIHRESLKETSRCLDSLGVRKNVALVLRNGEAEINGKEYFDSIVMSEVLEHVENPKELLEKVAAKLSRNGRIFINMPINSPAPDHIFLIESPLEVRRLIESAGLYVNGHASFPMTGFTLEKAMKKRATVSCVVVASKNKETRLKAKRAFFIK